MEKIQAEQKDKEKRELPPVSVDIFYSAHGTAEDIKGLAERLKEADIYIPEFFNWGREDLKIFRDVSDGRLKPEEGLEKLGKVFFSNFILKLFDIVYNSKKPIAFIDLPSEAPLAEQVRNLGFLKINFNLSFRGALGHIRSYVKDNSEVKNKREKYMIAGLKPRVRELLQIYPKLRNKKKLNVLLSMGSVHSSLYFEFKKEAAESRRGFKEMPQTFDFYEEGLRSEMFGKEQSDELIAHILLEEIFSDTLRPYLKSITKNSEKIGRFLRLIVSKYHIGEIEIIYQEVKKAKDGRELFGIFGQWFRKKDIKFPRTEKELDEILNK